MAGIRGVGGLGVERARPGVERDVMPPPLPPKPAAPTPGLYRHYKYNPYRVHHLAWHTEAREWVVVYEALYGDGGFFVRPAAMFVEEVEVGGRRVPRFAPVSGR